MGPSVDQASALFFDSVAGEGCWQSEFSDEQRPRPLGIIKAIAFVHRRHRPSTALEPQAAPPLSGDPASVAVDLDP